MKVYRLYVDGECVGTFGDGTAAMAAALRASDEWLNAGYTDVDIRHENYEK